MNILHCLPDQGWVDEMRADAPRDAAHIQQKYIAEGLHTRGHTITWLAPQNLDRVFISGPGETRIVPGTWTATRWFTFLEKLAWKAQQMLGVPYLNVFSNLRRYDACLQVLAGQDVVFERNGLYNAGVAMACEKKKLPYVMFFDADQIAELDFQGTPLKGVLRWRAANLLRFNLRVARRIICVSEVAKKHLVSKWNVPSEKLFVLPNAVDVERFKPDPGLRAKTRASLRLTNQPLIVFVGSFYQWHDIPTLLKAFAIVLEKHPDAYLLMVGDGKQRETMMEFASSLGMGSSVRFTGFVPHAKVAGYVNAADLAVVPVPDMQQEMWLSPMKLFEYMASGKPVVATALGQINEIVRDGQNGLLVPPGNQVAMINAITKLIEDVVLREQLGKQARDDVLLKHSWEQYLTHIENVLASA